MAEHDLERQPGRTVLTTGRDVRVGVREISNGFIVEESWTDKKGKFRQKETFSRLKPKLKVES